MNESQQRFEVQAFQKKDGSTIIAFTDYFGRHHFFDSSRPYSLWKWWHRPAWLVVSRRMKHG